MNSREFKSMLQRLHKSGDEGHFLRMTLWERLKETFTYTEIYEASLNKYHGHYYNHPLYAGLNSIYEEYYNDKESMQKN